MSHNITNWKTKRLESLVIPWSAFYISPRKDWHPTFETEANGKTRLKDFDLVLVGIKSGDHLHVTEIDISGEGSGSFMDMILEPALRLSDGTLTAVCVWEGGSEINRLVVKDGSLDWKNVEI